TGFTGQMISLAFGQCPLCEQVSGRGNGTILARRCIQPPQQETIMDVQHPLYAHVPEPPDPPEHDPSKPPEIPPEGPGETEREVDLPPREAPDEIQDPDDLH